MLLVLFDRQMVDAAGTDAGGGFGAEDDPVGMVLLNLLVLPGAVIDAGEIDGSGEAVADGVFGVVEGGGSGAGGVLLVEEIDEALGDGGAFGASLLRDFVSDGVHDDARMI